MNPKERLEFLFKALQRGLNIPEPKIVGNTVQFELDGETYTVKISKAR